MSHLSNIIIIIIINIHLKLGKKNKKEEGTL